MGCIFSYDIDNDDGESLSSTASVYEAFYQEDNESLHNKYDLYKS